MLIQKECYVIEFVELGQYIRSKVNTRKFDIASKGIVTSRAKLITWKIKSDSSFATVTSKMNITSEDSSSKVNESGLNIIPEIKVTPKIDAMSKITCETDAVPEKNFDDDVSKVNAASEIHVTSTTDIAFNKIDEAVDKSFDIERPPRRLRRKPPMDQQEYQPLAELNPIISKQKFETEDTDNTNTESEADENKNDVLPSDNNVFENIPHEENSRKSSSLADEKSKIQEASAVKGLFPKSSFLSETKKAESNTTESEKSKLERASAMIEVWKTRVVEASIEKRSEIKRKKAKLKSSVERKMESIERILEDHVERTLEENVEKHSWLQPIETWIVDRCKPSSSYTVTHCQQDVNEDVVSEPVYDFKFTSATTADEEPKIESGPLENRRAMRIDESKIERKMIEHFRKLRNRTGSPKSSRFESANPIAQLKKQEVPSHTENGEENNVLINPDILEVKEVKRHDLLDRLKDNVKEKMEDIYRVYTYIENEYLFFLSVKFITFSTISTIFHKNGL